MYRHVMHATVSKLFVPFTFYIRDLNLGEKNMCFCYVEHEDGQSTLQIIAHPYISGYRIPCVAFLVKTFVMAETSRFPAWAHGTKSLNVAACFVPFLAAKTVTNSWLGNVRLHVDDFMR